MTEVKELIERITQNPLAITDEIDWVKETDDFKTKRLREIVYNIPIELYEIVREIIIGCYYKSLSSQLYSTVPKYYHDDRFFEIEDEGYFPSIENFLKYTLDKRFEIERAAIAYEELKDSVRKKLNGNSETADDSDIKYKLQMLEIENNKLIDENNRLKEINTDLRTENELFIFFDRNDNTDNDDGITLGMTIAQWSAIRDAIIEYIENSNNAKLIKWREKLRNGRVTKTEIAKHLSRLTGLNIKQLSTNCANHDEREAAKNLLQALYELIPSKR